MKVKIIDKKTDLRARNSHAHHVNARTLELLEPSGVTAKLLDEVIHPDCGAS